MRLLAQCGGSLLGFRRGVDLAFRTLFGFPVLLAMIGSTAGACSSASLLNLREEVHTFFMQVVSDPAVDFGVVPQTRIRVARVFNYGDNT